MANFLETLLGAWSTSSKTNDKPIRTLDVFRIRIHWIQIRIRSYWRIQI